MDRVARNREIIWHASLQQLPTDAYVIVGLGALRAGNSSMASEALTRRPGTSPPVVAEAWLRSNGSFCLISGAWALGWPASRLPKHAGQPDPVLSSLVADALSMAIAAIKGRALYSASLVFWCTLKRCQQRWLGLFKACFGFPACNRKRAAYNLSCRGSLRYCEQSPRPSKRLDRHALLASPQVSNAAVVLARHGSLQLQSLALKAGLSSHTAREARQALGSGFSLAHEKPLLKPVCHGYQKLERPPTKRPVDPCFDKRRARDGSPTARPASRFSTRSASRPMAIHWRASAGRALARQKRIESLARCSLCGSWVLTLRLRRNSLVALRLRWGGAFKALGTPKASQMEACLPKLPTNHCKLPSAASFQACLPATARGPNRTRSGAANFGRCHASGLRRFTAAVGVKPSSAAKPDWHPSSRAATRPAPETPRFAAAWVG